MKGIRSSLLINLQTEKLIKQTSSKAKASAVQKSLYYPTDWEKIFANHISNKKLVVTYIQTSQNSPTKKSN